VNRQCALAFLVSAVASAFIWALSPLLTGHGEPWDADGPFYVGSLVVAGLGAGALIPKSFWAHYLGSIVGQLGYEVLFLNLGPLFLIGVVILLGYSVIFLAAAGLSAYLRNKVTVGNGNI
jgi:hypothetical protein